MDVVAYCLAHGAEVRNSIMTFIAEYGTEKSYQYLLEHDAVDIKQVTPWKGTVLGIAVQFNRLDEAR